MIGAADHRRDDPLQPFTLDAMVSGAARVRPERVALASRGEGTGDCAPLTFAELAGQVSMVAGQLASMALRAGETIMVAGGASAATDVLTLAGLRASLDVALTGLHPTDIAAAAVRIGATAIVGEPRHGRLLVAETLLRVAAASPKVRFVATYGIAPARLIAPITIAADLARADIVSAGQLSALVLVSRRQTVAHCDPPAAPPVHHLAALGECAAVLHNAVETAANGDGAGRARYISRGRRRILAFESRGRPGALEIRGAAVSGGASWRRP